MCTVTRLPTQRTSVLCCCFATCSSLISKRSFAEIGRKAHISRIPRGDGQQIGTSAGGAEAVKLNESFTAVIDKDNHLSKVLEGSADQNEYKLKYFNFVTAHGFSEASDLAEQFSLLSESERTQFDPDDAYGQRLPVGHTGRRDDDYNSLVDDGVRRRKSDTNTPPRFSHWTEKEKYNGRGFRREKQEFDHFHKALVLDSVPPFPEKMTQSPPTQMPKNRIQELRRRAGLSADLSTDALQRMASTVDVTETNYPIHTGLYLPHVSQWLPQWSLKKKIAKTYGPSYLGRVTLPPIGLPTNEEFDTMLRQRTRERLWKGHAIEVMNKVEAQCTVEAMSDTLSQFVSERQSERMQQYEDDVGNELWTDTQVGCGHPFVDESKDVIPRLFETWDTALCHALKGRGDPKLPKRFKDAVFREYVLAIDRNGSMAPWQKNYAFSLLPKAFGGPQGEYLEAILGRMKSKEDKVFYSLPKYEENLDAGKKITRSKKTKKKGREMDAASTLGAV